MHCQSEGVECRHCHDFWDQDRNFTSILVHEKYCVLFKGHVVDVKGFDERPTGEVRCNFCDKISSRQDEVLRHIFKKHKKPEFLSPEEQKWVKYQVNVIVNFITFSSIHFDLGLQESEDSGAEEEEEEVAYKDPNRLMTGKNCTFQYQKRIFLYKLLHFLSCILDGIFLSFLKDCKQKNHKKFFLLIF